jgi:hypothetical protein
MTTIEREEITEPVKVKRLLNPVDRISEILFGLIMALTFTCTISVIDTDRAEVRGMLIGALGCNVAWGLVDAVMYLIMTMTERGRGSVICDFVRNSTDVNKSTQFISDAIPPVIASVMTVNEFESLRNRIRDLPESQTKGKLNSGDYKSAVGVFLLVFLSTFPIAIPFIVIGKVHTALRVSNLIAIIMMFLCGWGLAKYSGRKRFLTGLLLSTIGILLVLITIALGG